MISTRHKTNHGQAAVVDLGEEALLLVGRGHVAEAEAERVVKVEQDLLERAALALDGRVVARLAALGVVRVRLREAGALAVRLEHAHRREDLELADHGDVRPLLLGRAARDVAPVGQDRVVARDDVADEVARRLHEEAEEAGHGDAAVLDLGVAQVADRRLVAEAPEVEVGAAERVPDALEGQGRRVLGAEALEVRLGLLDLDRRARRGRRDERRGAAEGEGGDDLLPAFFGVR